MERWKELSNNNIIVEGHYDLPLHVFNKREKGQVAVINNHYLSDMQEGCLNVAVAPVYVEDCYLPGMGLKVGLKQVMYMKREADESLGQIKICASYDEITECVNKNKIALVLGFEGLEPIEGDLDLLRVFYELGVRIAGVSWSRRNFAADGCGFEKKEATCKGGLTEAGKDAVVCAEELGMIIDVTHLSEQSFWDVMRATKEVLIASHTNCRSVFDIVRNFSDEQIKAITERGGVIGINGVSSLAAPADNDDSITVLVDHIDHIKKLVGMDHVGIGLDLMEFLEDDKSSLEWEQDGIKRVDHDMVLGYKNLKNLTQELIRRKYSDEDICKFLGGNFLRVFKNRLVN